MNQDNLHQPDTTSQSTNEAPLRRLCFMMGSWEAQNFFAHEDVPEFYEAIDKAIDIIEANGFEVNFHIHQMDDDGGVRPFGLNLPADDFEEAWDDDDDEAVAPDLPTFHEWLQQGILLFRHWGHEMETRYINWHLKRLGRLPQTIEANPQGNSKATSSITLE